MRSTTVNTDKVWSPDVVPFRGVDTPATGDFKDELFAEAFEEAPRPAKADIVPAKVPTLFFAPPLLTDRVATCQPDHFANVHLGIAYTPNVRCRVNYDDAGREMYGDTRVQALACHHLIAFHTVQSRGAEKTTA